MTSLTNARLVLPDRVEAGDLHLDGAEIAAAPVPGAAAVDLGGRYVVPGFVDMHVHGGAGASYQSGVADDARRAAAFHLSRGTTTTVASLVTGTPEELRAAVACLAPLAAEGVVAGVHLEGPYLARARCGAHDPDLLRAPDPAEFAALADLAGGHLRMITIAPELPGALDLVRAAAARGVLAAVGHTEATAATVRAAFDAGARAATHLFNAMRPLHHREGGPVAAALADPRVTVELIGDGMHVAADVAALVFAAAGADRVALVTDAMAAAGLGDGDYRLGVMDVAVRGGRATLAGGTSMAGSTITLADAFRRAVRAGVPLPDAARAASLTPARALGLDGRIGTLEPGKRADLVVLEEDLTVARVMRGGRWTGPPGLPDLPPAPGQDALDLRTGQDVGDN
ncbi:N-acetylglucosamine-6-phosphate deacetylase [Actinomadura parmotrematis]|uniref:N-acetylglucosamine-6-phosphate deacetylase n=1 Tax=Actinomadura parmotrematis TaxID=2864039 RepID=A0ABS7FMU6_9ACTN|nr:N-acetylglucosamine-6-phosphate deacetylase [Actinomadura parmotrematis]MBW8481700.1 N-acetylglucosamine-6-phosphate deacetylase [Actinomadura parmotrematis]